MSEHQSTRVPGADNSWSWHDREGRLHREGGPALETWCGDRKWYRHGQLHREDGPADLTWLGDEGWYRDGVLHREDGPAVVRRRGRYTQWFVRGRLCTDREIQQLRSRLSRVGALVLVCASRRRHRGARLPPELWDLIHEVLLPSGGRSQQPAA